MAQTTEVMNIVLNQPKNVKTFNKYLGRLGLTDDDEMKRAIYQTIGDITEGKSTLKEVLTRVKNKRVNWDHPMFDDMKKKIEEHDDYLVNPFEVAEGVIKCGGCGSMRTFSCQKQCRGGDEPMTTFSRCVDCGKTQTYSG